MHWNITYVYNLNTYVYTTYVYTTYVYATYVYATYVYATYVYTTYVYTTYVYTTYVYTTYVNTTYVYATYVSTTYVYTTYVYTTFVYTTYVYTTMCILPMNIQLSTYIPILKLYMKLKVMQVCSFLHSSAHWSIESTRTEIRYFSCLKPFRIRSKHSGKNSKSHQSLSKSCSLSRGRS